MPHERLLVAALDFLINFLAMDGHFGRAGERVEAAAGDPVQEKRDQRGGEDGGQERGLDARSAGRVVVLEGP